MDGHERLLGMFGLFENGWMVLSKGWMVLRNGWMVEGGCSDVGVFDRVSPGVLDEKVFFVRGLEGVLEIIVGEWDFAAAGGEVDDEYGESQAAQV